MDARESSRKSYLKKKENGLCCRCSSFLDRKGYYCSECLEKIRVYHRENRDFYRKNHICTVCGKQKVFGDEKTCLKCRAKRENKRKPLTEEQKKQYGEHFKAKQKNLYQQRKKKGICTRCGKRKAMSGKAKCGICLEKDAEIHRKRYMDRPNIKEYRKINHLCYYCGNEIDVDKGQLCSSCLERCRQNGIKGAKANDYWKNDNKFVFKKEV